MDIDNPLNLTDNFDGQKTGQHGLWVRLLEKLPQAMSTRAQGLARRRELPRRPEGVRLLDDEATYVWLDNLLYLEELARRGKPGYGDIYFEDLAHQVGPILRRAALERGRGRGQLLVHRVDRAPGGPS